MKARVTVTLKSGVLDPQGKAIEGALRSLGIEGVTDIRQGKVFDVTLTGAEPGAARALLSQACERLLANTVVETYEIALEPAAAAPSAAEAADMPAEGHP